MLRALVFWSSVGFLTFIVGHVTFTNIKCSHKNETIFSYKYCYIKAVNRTHKYINVLGKINSDPLDNITVNIQTKRFDHGYKPFFVNLTIDACMFLKNRRNVVTNLLFSTFADRSNLNHTCPFAHDVIIDKLWTGNIEEDLIKHFPVPNGDYALFLTFYAYKMEICTTELYMKLTN